LCDANVQVLITAPAMTYRYSSINVVNTSALSVDPITGIIGFLNSSADVKRQLFGINAVLRDAACTQALLQVHTYHKTLYAVAAVVL
jgi:hypothetical protein